MTIEKDASEKDPFDSAAAEEISPAQPAGSDYHRHKALMEALAIAYPKPEGARRSDEG